MVRMMKFSVVTPCLNPGDLLPETVESILGQRALLNDQVDLEYVIVDGGSTDGTKDYLESLNDPRVSCISEPDKGMYDALAKGLERLTGDIHSYLNAGDLYHPHAFDVVTDVIDRTDGWLTGMAVKYNQRGDVIFARLPFAYRTRWFRKRVYDGRLLRFVQQESTFWTRAMTRRLDLERLRTFRLAGDAFLWASFSEWTDLTVVAAHLGGYRRHGEHLGNQKREYREEMRSFTRMPMPWDIALAAAHLILEELPPRLKHPLGRGRILTWQGEDWA